MNQKVFAVLGVVALLSANAYAQRPLKMAKQVTESMTGGVASAFSKNVPVSVLNTEVLGGKVVRAQFMATPKAYISSAALFEQVRAAQGFGALKPAEVKSLAQKFAKLDEIVQFQSADFRGYWGALWSEKPAEVNPLLAPQVNSLINLLDIQLYMKQHNNEFPQLFTVAAGGWLLATDVWTDRAGSAAVRQVLDILLEEQAGRANPAVVAQLVSLYVNATNPVPVDRVVEQLANWRAAHHTDTLAPQLPKSSGEISSLRSSSAENIWLSMQIRLLQLTPNLELPQVLKDACVGW